MNSHIQYMINRLGEKLWVKPLLMCLLSVGAAFFARVADHTGMGDRLPEITSDSIVTLLSTISSSMLVIATFAVSSMVAAYASASNTATPRSFALIVADDVSQNALSSFIGAFIFSIVALIAIKNSYYGRAGNFALFILTLMVFAIVIFTFVKWVDNIARLGRLGNTIEKIEQATANAFTQRLKHPHLGGVPASDQDFSGRAITSEKTGYVKSLNVADIQQVAEDQDCRVRVVATPGSFVSLGEPLAHFLETTDDAGISTEIADKLQAAFLIGAQRTFDDDPGFGLIALSEIASRAMSPAVNDPGTAIDVINSLQRLLAEWITSEAKDSSEDEKADRVEVPGLDVADLFDDAFTGVARDGAGTMEVAVKLQKALSALAGLDNEVMSAAAKHHAETALARTKLVMKLDADLDRVMAAAE